MTAARLDLTAAELADLSTLVKTFRARPDLLDLLLPPPSVPAGTREPLLIELLAPLKLDTLDDAAVLADLIVALTRSPRLLELFADLTDELAEADAADGTGPRRLQ